MADWQQYGVLVIGLLIGGGFAFGGIASYAGLTDSGNQNNQEFNATVPEENYVNESFGLSGQEQRLLAYRDNVVFVNVFYNESEEQDFSEIEQLPERFNEKVYVSTASTSDASSLYYTYDSPTTGLPMAVIVGGSRSYQTQAIEDLSQERISSEICNAFRSIDPVSTQCIG